MRSHIGGQSIWHTLWYLAIEPLVKPVLDKTGYDIREQVDLTLWDGVGDTNRILINLPQENQVILLIKSFREMRS